MSEWVSEEREWDEGRKEVKEYSYPLFQVDCYTVWHGCLDAMCRSADCVLTEHSV